MKISVSRWKEQNKDQLLGYADLSIDELGMVIKGCAYREGRNGMWVSVPSRAYPDPAGGKTKYAGYVSFPEREVYDDFQASAKEAIEAHLAGIEQFSSDGMEEDVIPF